MIYLLILYIIIESRFINVDTISSNNDNKVPVQKNKQRNVKNKNTKNKSKFSYKVYHVRMIIVEIKILF